MAEIYGFQWIKPIRLRKFSLLSCSILLSACAGQTSPEDPPIIHSKPTVSVRSEPLESVQAPQKNPPFSTWLKQVREDAVQKGIRPDVVDAALNDARPIRRVIQLDRNQPEFKLTYDQYMDRVVPYSRILKARVKYKENKSLLDRIGRKYGVQPQFLVAFWGVETDFGRTTGGFPIVSSLATLAHDGRRSEFFYKELMHSLRILDEQNIPLSNFKGSWAGAMGQCQFMPSTFVNYAVDGDDDGRIDLWGSKADVFSSAANFLSQSGWNSQNSWGRPVLLPNNFDKRLSNGEAYSLRTWAALGVKTPEGTPLPDLKQKAALLFADDDKNGPAFLVYDNYFTTLKWNRSKYYALAVGQLADAIVNG